MAQNRRIPEPKKSKRLARKNILRRDPGKDRNLEIGTRIRNRRLEMELSQEEFASLIGISPSYLSAIERGIRRVSARICTTIHQTTGLSCDYILTGHSDEFHYNYDKGNQTPVPSVSEKGTYQERVEEDSEETDEDEPSFAQKRLSLLFCTCTDFEATLCYSVCHTMLAEIRENSAADSVRERPKTGQRQNFPE